MNGQRIFRHELKYVLRPGDYYALRSRFRAVLHPDPNAGNDGCYSIASLYFDDLADSALIQNYSGVSDREKYRIRLYNGDRRTLHLEKKVKHAGLGTKYSCPLTETQLRSLLDGDYSWMMESGAPLLEELYCRMRNDLLRPKTVVAYRREPYVYGPGNVRVTFDFDIRSSIRATDLLSPQLPLVPASAGTVLMEVKYDSFLPDAVRLILQEGLPRVQAFSKYAACRQFDI